MRGKAWLGALCDRRWLCGFGVLCIIWRRTSNKVLGWPYEIVWRWSTESVGRYQNLG